MILTQGKAFGFLSGSPDLGFIGVGRGLLSHRLDNPPPFGYNPHTMSANAIEEVEDKARVAKAAARTLAMPRTPRWRRWPQG